MLNLGEYLSQIQSNTDVYLYYLLMVIFIASNLDFSFGWINAKFNKEVNFRSGIALYGIIKKMMYFIILVFFFFISFLIVPYEIAVSSLSILYIGYLVSEVNSILSHLGLTSDGKKGSLFIDFLKNILGKGK